MYIFILFYFFLLKFDENKKINKKWNKKAFEWFQDLVEALEAEDIDHFLDIQLFLTGGLKADQVFLLFSWI